MVFLADGMAHQRFILLIYAYYIRLHVIWQTLLSKAIYNSSIQHLWGAIWGVQYFAQGHFGMQMGRLRIELST